MRKHLNLILSCASLFVTGFLLVVALMAWYISNDSVKATGIIGKTEDTTADFKLYYWDKNSSKWILSEGDLSIEAWPDDEIYFKLVADGLTVNNDYSAHFTGITSVLNTDIVTAQKNTSIYNVLYNNIVMYSSQTSNVIVTTDEEQKTLYTITEEEAGSYQVNLDDYKIEDVFRLFTSPVIENDVPKSLGSVQASSLESAVFDYKATSSNAIDYFALSFVTTGDDIVDSYYQFQGLSIKSLFISN